MLPQEKDAELRQKIANGFIVETEDDMTPGYKKALEVILTVQGDTELVSAPAYYFASKDAPTINSRLAVYAIIQDELGHANIAYRLLEDLGVSKQWLMYGESRTSSSIRMASTSRWRIGRRWWWPMDSSTAPASRCSPMFTKIAPTARGSARSPKLTAKKFCTCATARVG
jgi:hypothetical protein